MGYVVRGFVPEEQVLRAQVSIREYRARNLQAFWVPQSGPETVLAAMMVGGIRCR